MVHPIVINELIVFIANSFIGEIDIEDMDIVGNFLATLGAMLIFNSSYLARVTIKEEASDENKDEIDTIKESIEQLNKKRSF